MSEMKIETSDSKRGLITTKVVGQAVTWTIRGAGEGGSDATLRIDLNEVDPAIKAHAAIHGIVQRVSDRAAIARSEKTGFKTASAGDKFKAMQALVDHYNAGATDWDLPRGAGTGEGKSAAAREASERALLVEALVMVKPLKTKEFLTEWVAGKTKAECEGMLLHPMMLEVVAELRMKKIAESGVNAGEMLDGLDEGPSA